MKYQAKPKRESTIEEYKLIDRFESLRRQLLQPEYADRLEKHLAYWALASDRRMPLAFMGRSLRSILETPFEELMATQGVGHKKIAALMTLLWRATQDSPPDMPYGTDRVEIPGPQERGRMGAAFNPALVSEALWTEWRETVKRHGLGQMKLGRLAPTLEALPTVIWHRPLEAYMDRSLADIRQLKTHGEKRVRAVLEVFWVVHETLSESAAQAHLDVDLLPKFVRRVERWMAEVLAGLRTPSVSEIRTGLAQPLLNQIRVDVGEPIWKLVSERLGMEDRARSVREQSREMGVTRARIYQLLEECGKVMAVRWPEGEHLLAALVEKLEAETGETEAVALLRAVADIFFPKARDAVHVVADRLKVDSLLGVPQSGNAV
jgi:hypothetical protein